jgi:hypothetical protein
MCKMTALQAGNRVLGLVGATVLLFATSHAAQADTDGSPLARAAASCPVASVCFWPEPNFGGQVQVWDDPEVHSCDWAPARPAKSIYNNDDNDTWSFYRDANCRDHARTLKVGESDGNVDVTSWQ